MENSIANKQLIYLDSSTLLRNTNLKFLTKNFTREAYLNNPSKFMKQLNISFQKNKLIEDKYKSLLLLLLNNNYINYIISMDCTLHSYEDNLLNIFGTLSDNSTDLSNVCLYDENIAFDKYQQSYFLIKNASQIIIDDNFCSLQIGRYLLSKATTNSITFLSTFVNNENMNTGSLINALNKFFNLQS